METQELNHKATARQKERPERWVGGMSSPSLRWLLGAENVYWYRDPGERNRDVWSTGPGGLQICYWKWENMSMNQLQQWKQSQNGLGFVAVSSGNMAVGGLWLHEVRKSTQSFLSSPNGCCCKLRRASRPCGGLNTKKEQHRVVVNIFASNAACGAGEGQRRTRWEEKNGRLHDFRGDKWWLLCDGSTDSCGF